MSSSENFDRKASSGSTPLNEKELPASSRVDIDDLEVRKSKANKDRKKGVGSIVHYTETDEFGEKPPPKRPDVKRNEGRPGQDTLIWNSKLYKVTFSCTDLNVYTKATRKKPRAAVLYNISAIFKPGTTTALMGPSGAGKTTLLNVLSGRTQSSLTVNAKALQMNGAKLTQKDVKSFSSLVPQDDILIAVLTPRELITYAANLVLKGPPNEVTSIINKTLKVLSLTHCADTMCGDADIKGISGGERKRASIGLELITNPSCIFLDEPTSGLDSKVALDVVSTMRDLAAEGRTIICTIHQPSYEIFQRFDRLLLLRKGRVAYQGRISEVNRYFEEIRHPCPQYQNPADHILNVVSDYDTTDEFLRHELYDEFTNYARGVGVGDMELLKEKQDESKSEFQKIPILFRRSMYTTYKDTKQLRTRFIQVIIVGLIAGLTYLQLEKKQTASYDRQSALLMVTTFIIMSSVMTTINAIPMEKTVLKREYDNGTYSVFSFYIARIFVYFIYQIFYVTIYAAIAYFMIGLSATFNQFLIFYMALMFGGCIAVALGFFFGSLLPTVQQATSVVPMFILPLILFSGLLIAFENIPVYFVWLYYISFLQYVYRILVVNEFKELEFDACTADDLSNPGRCPYGICAPEGFEQEENNTRSFPCSGEFVLQTTGFDNLEIYESFLILLAYLFVVMVLCYIGVHNLLNRQQKISFRALFEYLRGPPREKEQVQDRANYDAGENKF